MKKIVIVTNRLTMGGIEKALIEMLNNMSRKDIDISLLVRLNGGELFNFVPHDVRVDCIFKSESIKNMIIKNIKKFNLIKGLYQIYHMQKARKSTNSYYYHYNIIKCLDDMEEEYDLAIAYGVHFSFPTIYVLDKIKSKNKVMWVHSDSSEYIEKIKLYARYIEKYNHIFCVSKQAQQEFLNIFPLLNDRCSVFYNSIYYKDIQQQALEYTELPYSKDGVKVITVGRVAKEKGVYLAVNVVDKLIKSGYNVAWYWIGDGEEKENIQHRILNLNLNNSFFLLGNKLNPFPYVKYADIYVQPSIHEGYCIALGEARALYKPIVTTDFAGAREQIINEKNGLIVETTEEGIYKGIVRIIEEKYLREEFIQNLSSEVIDTRKEVQKLYKYL